MLPFVEGWGVELGLLVDVVERFGRDAVAQVDLDVREHRNRPLDELAPQALAIIATALRHARTSSTSIAPVVELLRGRGHRRRLDVDPSRCRERPPIITMPANTERVFARPPR